VTEIQELKELFPKMSKEELLICCEHLAEAMENYDFSVVRSLRRKFLNDRLRVGKPPRINTKMLYSLVSTNDETAFLKNHLGSLFDLVVLSPKNTHDVSYSFYVLRGYHIKDLKNLTRLLSLMGFENRPVHDAVTSKTVRRWCPTPYTETIGRDNIVGSIYLEIERHTTKQ